MAEKSSGIERLVEVLSQPLSRKSFAVDPHGTLERAEIRPSEIPQPLLDALVDLSYEELQVIVRSRARLEQAGASVDILGMVH